MKDKHLHFIKLSLTLSYSTKQSQQLRLILWVPSTRSSPRFDNDLTINLELSINFIL